MTMSHAEKFDSLENSKNAGSVSTIRDETSLTNRNTSRLKEHINTGERTSQGGTDSKIN